MRKRWLVVAGAAPLALIGAGVAAAAAPDGLRTSGPTSVAGTEASAVFAIADRQIRQVRYADQGTLVYSFRLDNDGPLPVRVDGLSGSASDPRLFDVLSLTDDAGAEQFSVGAGDSREVHLTLRMTGCETLSARAGSIVDSITLETSGPVGWGSGDTVVPLPEEVRAGSPREAGCADATSSSRPPG